MASPDQHTKGSESTDASAVRSNVEDVYAQLRQTILSGELRAGSSLSQVQLAAKYDMSRGPLREALRLLERDGLIVTEHQRMVRVAPVSFDDLDELYALRIINESFAVGCAVARLTDAHIQRAASHLANMEIAADTDDWIGWRAEHRAFHSALYEPARRRTEHLLSELFDHADRYRRLYHESEGQAPALAAVEHHGLLEACIARDGEEAQSLLARHLGRTVLTLFATAAPAHDPVRVREAMRFAIGNL